jgi:hypothetical protein
MSALAIYPNIPIRFILATGVTQPTGPGPDDDTANDVMSDDGCPNPRPEPPGSAQTGRQFSTQDDRKEAEQPREER